MEKVFADILEKARVYCRDETDLIHVNTALEMAKKLISLEGGNEKIIIPAIILHDLGWHLFSPEEELRARKITRRIEEIVLSHKHETESAVLAEKILSELNYPEEEKRQIIEIIAWHDTRTEAISREDMIVKDSDRLSKYTPQCFDLFCLKLKKTQEEFFDFLNLQIEKGLFTDSARFRAREYLVKRRLGLPEVEFERGLISKFYEFLIRLESEIVKRVRRQMEEIAIRTAKEKVYDVKKMIELYLANHTYIDLTELQKDEEFCSIATQKVSIGGYIGVIDRETGRIIFHPDKRCINLAPEEIKKTLRPPEYLHKFWDWHKRARDGEEFYSYYQGMNISGEIIDKFQYVVPLNIKNAHWALVAAAAYEDFFQSIDILSKEIIHSIGEISDQIGKLAKLVEERTNELIESNKQLQFEINERKQMEKDLLKAERLAATAQIAAEAAHEIKNPLHVINAGLYYLKMIADKGDAMIQQTIQQMDSALIRTTGFTNDLLNFSRPIELKRDKVNINKMITEAMDELPKEMLANIVVNKKLSLDIPEIWADSDRLKQVMVNLIKNAVESMEGRESRRLEVESREEEEFVKISVSDTGKGIPEKDLAEIFDPFHTTKAKGIGLGLAICQRFVEAHHGRIEIESTIGKGTTFVVCLLK